MNKENNLTQDINKKSSFRFLGWLVLFILLLATIPLLINLGYVKIAKTFGVVLIFSISGALMIWRKQTASRNHKASRVAITINEKFWLRDNIQFFRSLNAEGKQVFQDRIALFLSEVQIAELGTKNPDKDYFLMLASSATEATWGLPYFNFENMQKLLLFGNNNNFNLKHLESPEQDVITLNIERLILATQGDAMENNFLEKFWIQFIENQSADKSLNIDFWNDLKTIANPDVRFNTIFAC